MDVADEYAALVAVAFGAASSHDAAVPLHQLVDIDMAEHFSAQSVDVVHQLVDNEMAATP